MEIIAYLLMMPLALIMLGAIVFMIIEAIRGEREYWLMLGPLLAGVLAMIGLSML